MKKTEYIAPEMEVVELKMNQALLTESNNQGRTADDTDPSNPIDI